MKPVKLSPFMKELAGVTPNRLDFFDPMRVINICELGRSIIKAQFLRLLDIMSFVGVGVALMGMIHIPILAFSSVSFNPETLDGVFLMMGSAGYTLLIGCIISGVCVYVKEVREKKLREGAAEFFNLDPGQPPSWHQIDVYKSRLSTKETRFGFADFIRNFFEKICIPVETD